MMRKFFFSLLLLLFTCVFSCEIFCQEKKDTIFFDEDWSICEKPVAAYYRVCELNKSKAIFYKGDVKDYFIDGSIEMTGHYNKSGYKEGEFTFYNNKGQLIIKGQYLNNEMSGRWFFYDSNGRLTVEFYCKNTNDFVPVTIVNSNNDTLLKNGTGKFILNMQTDLPNTLYGWKNFMIEGEVENNSKKGTFNYYKNKKLIFSQTYQNGKLKSNNGDVSIFILESAYWADYVLRLNPANLDKIDAFNHSNFVFEYGGNGDQKLIEFLLYKQSPQIIASAQTTSDNDVLLFDIIKGVLYINLIDPKEVRDQYYTHFSLPVEVYYSRAYSNIEKNTFSKIEGKVILTIDTWGYVVNSVFNCNLSRAQIDKINYYLEHVSNLQPYKNGVEKGMMNVNIKLNMVIDTLKNDSFHVSYLIYNADSVDENNLSNYILSKANDSIVQIEAKFPGGRDAWRKYLEKNLNANILLMHHAPDGNYTVTVSFMVDENGKVSDVRAENDPGYGTAEEAVRVIKKGPNWMPAIKDGRFVAYRQKQNIVFQVSGQ
jgi:antitoxin component YwqK of YwqJK toxin-antitoxin module